MRNLPLALALLAVAGCGGEPEPLRAPPAKPLSGEFTTLTYNVAGLPQEISKVRPRENIPRISPLLAGYDIVLTQEDFDWWRPGLDKFDFANYHARLRAETGHPWASARHPGPELRPLRETFEVEKFRDAEGRPLSDHDALAVKWRWTARVHNPPR